MQNIVANHYWRKILFIFQVVMLTLPMPHVCFFHFSDTCSLGSNDSTKFLESTIVFDSFSEGQPSTGSRMLCHSISLFSRCLVFLPYSFIFLIDRCLGTWSSWWKEGMFVYSCTMIEQSKYTWPGIWQYIGNVGLSTSSNCILWGKGYACYSKYFISILNQTPKQVKHDWAHNAKSTLFTAHLPATQSSITSK